MELLHAEKKMLDLMTLHGLPARGWRFEFDSAKSRAGSCCYNTRMLTLSKSITLLNDEKAITDTILHEIAHALAGRGVGHGSEWRKVAVSIGCNGARCHSHTVPERAMQGTCPVCERVIMKHRRGRVACSVCCNLHNAGKFHIQFLINWVKLN